MSQKAILAFIGVVAAVGTAAFLLNRAEAKEGCENCNVDPPDPCCKARVTQVIESVIQEGQFIRITVIYHNNTEKEIVPTLTLDVNDPDDEDFAIQLRSLTIGPKSAEKFEWRLSLVPKKGVFVLKFNVFENDNTIIPMSTQKIVNVRV